MIAVKKINIGTLGLPNPFHIREHTENISLATGVTRAAWRWTRPNVMGSHGWIFPSPSPTSPKSQAEDIKISTWLGSYLDIFVLEMSSLSNMKKNRLVPKSGPTVRKRLYM